MAVPSRKLLGTYRTPRFHYGSVVSDLLRGKVEIVGLSSGRIPWPIGKKGRAKSLVLYGALARAVRRESSVVICHWWGVGLSTVQKWRRALGVDPINEGTRQLKVVNGKSPLFANALKAMWKKARDPERCEKIAASKRGKPRPKHVIETVRMANLGRKHTDQARANMSAGKKRYGAWPPAAGRPWTKEEKTLLATLPPAEVAKRISRPLSAVYAMRTKLGLNKGRTERWAR